MQPFNIHAARCKSHVCPQHIISVIHVSGAISYQILGFSILFITCWWGRRQRRAVPACGSAGCEVSHVQSATCNMHATCMQHSCNMHATCMRHGCNMHATWKCKIQHATSSTQHPACNMQHSCDTNHTRNMQHVCNMQHACKMRHANVRSMQHKAYLQHMSNMQHAHNVHHTCSMNAHATCNMSATRILATYTEVL